MNKKLLFFAVFILFLSFLPEESFASNSVGVIINGSPVEFTSSTGLPYVDNNGRTMVPLRATMESAGLVVGYDNMAKTAIVISEHNRVEIPINSNKVYADNNEIINDTKSVVKNGITYLPIRIVFENVGYTVEWDSNLKNVNAYNFNYKNSDLSLYSTSDPKTLIKNILNGNVVYLKGQYYATPDYVKSISNAKLHYSGKDLNKAIYPSNSLTDRDIMNALTNKESEKKAKDTFNEEGWISGLNFDYLDVSDSELKSFNVKGDSSKIPGFSKIYTFYENGLTSIKIIYPIDEITTEFINSKDGSGVFNGINMKKKDGVLFFKVSDLKDKGIL